MKAVYERPRINIEGFVASKAIASCNSNVTIKFSCLQGPQVDERNVMSSAYDGRVCTMNIGYSEGAKYAINKEGNRGSGDTTYMNVGYSQANGGTTATVKSGFWDTVQGLLYFTLTGRTGCTCGWTEHTDSNNVKYLVFDDVDGADGCDHFNRGSHVQVSPIFASVNVGS